MDSHISVHQDHAHDNASCNHNGRNGLHGSQLFSNEGYYRTARERTRDAAEALERSDSDHRREHSCLQSLDVGLGVNYIVHCGAQSPLRDFRREPHSLGGEI